MSEILARIRVRETAGIRRFLYPLFAILPSIVPAEEDKTKTLDERYNEISVRTVHGQGLPCQIGPVSFSTRDRVDFAVSLAPGETQEIEIISGASSTPLSDPLHTSMTLVGSLQNVQEHFALAITREGCLKDIVYDGVSHLRGLTRITRNGIVFDPSSSFAKNVGAYFLSAQIFAKGRYDDQCFAETQTDITACKSWATVTHALAQPKPNDEIVFSLSLAITASTLTCDFGVGGYVFGKLDEKATEIVWRTEFGDAPYAKWTIATAGRTDYVGEVETAEAFLPQRWFHLIDSDKALAVAITKMPETCRELTVRLTHEGNVTIAFRLGETVTDPAEFGVCYHFLNDIPAIAAATNPQSILLPPTAEVLPV